MTALLSTDDFRDLAKAGQHPDGPVYRFTTTEPQLQSEASRKIRFVFSDQAVDHSNDRILAAGWDLGAFRRNPVALFSHDSSAPPIGRASSVVVQGDRLVGDIEFADSETYPFADTIYRLVKGKYLNAVSVGFKPIDWAFTADKTRPNGIDFKKQALLEISVCPVPCNPNALVEARSAGIDTRPLKAWAERVLDSGDTGAMPRRQVEVLRGQAGDGGRRATTRSASLTNHPLQATIDDIGASIGATRKAIRDVQAAMESTDGPALDETQLKQAIGHFGGAITSKNMAAACLRGALASAEDNAEPVTSNPGAPEARNAAARLREAAELRRSITTETPTERRQTAAGLKRSLGASTQTPADRMSEARDIKRQLERDGLI